MTTSKENGFAMEEYSSLARKLRKGLKERFKRRQTWR